MNKGALGASSFTLLQPAIWFQGMEKGDFFIFFSLILHLNKESYCVLMVCCGLNNNAFKLFVKEHIVIGFELTISFVGHLGVKMFIT